MYAQAVSAPRGWRVGSIMEYWPITRKGSAGTACVAATAADRVSSSMLSATWITGARRASAAAQGIGALSAQSTLTVLESYWNRSSRRSRDAGTWRGSSSLP